MTSKQFRALLDESLMSQRQMAKALGLNERTIRRYVEPGAKIPRVVELAARWVAQESLRKLSEM